MTTKEETLAKLKILLVHWQAHNEEHEREFKRWAETAKGVDSRVYDAIMEAANRMEGVNESLYKALELIRQSDEGDETDVHRGDPQPL